MSWTPESQARPGARGGDAVDLLQVGAALRRRWRWVALPTALALAASVAFVSLVTPRYTGEAKLLLESRDTVFTRAVQDRVDQAPQIDEQAVLSQVQVVMSRDLAREAIKRLGLVGNPEFDPLAEPGIGLVKRLMIVAGFVKDPHDRAPEDRVLEAYYDQLLVFQVGKSRILQIEFRAKDAELAARAANTVAELYLSLQEDAKKDTARSASTWLGGSIEGLRKRVAEAEAKVEEFRARTGLLVVGAINPTSINGQQLADLNTQLAQARSAGADAEAKARLIRDLIKSGRTAEIPDVANNDLIRRFQEQRVTLRAQMALEGRTLLPEHPRMKELAAQVADLEGQIRGASERTVRTLENDARIAGSRVETLQAALDAQKRVVLQANENEVQLRALEREAKAQRDQLEAYLGRYREAVARDAENAMPPDARIVSRAIVPLMPSFPRKVPIIAFSTVAALVLSAGTVVGLELLAATGAPERSPLPRPERLRIAARREDEPADASAELAVAPESYGGLIARLSRAEVEGRGRRVLLTGLDPALVEASARALGGALSGGARVILVVLDAASDQTPQRGFAELVQGEASFLEVIQREPHSRLHLVQPGAEPALGRAESWAGVDLALAAFDQTYDWVLCTLTHGQATLLAPLASRVDAVVVNGDPLDEPIAALYAAAREAGAPDVMVARQAAEETSLAA